MKKNDEQRVVIDELIATLKEPMEELQQLQIAKLKNEEDNVEYIIKNNIQSEQEIERVFDNLLDLTYWYGEEIKEIYYRLLDYSKNINKEVSEDYEKYYLEIINE